MCHVYCVSQVTGAQIPLGLPRPLTGEPNNVAEKCAQMYGEKKSVRLGKWNDISCTLADSYAKVTSVVLCQKKAKH